MNIDDILTSASTQELTELLAHIPEELEQRRQAQVDVLKDKIVEKSKIVNELGRRVYTNKEIAKLLEVKTYYVAEVLKEYNNNIETVGDTNGDNNDTN